MLQNFALRTTFTYLFLMKIQKQENYVIDFRGWDPFLRGPEVSHFESCSKIANLMTTDLFDVHILNINIGVYTSLSLNAD